MIPETSLLRRCCVIVPTYNASPYWKDFQYGLDRHAIDKSQVLVVDSSSTDSTPSLVRNAGYSLVTIPKESFRHGKTRQMAAEYLPWAEYVVFFTQDAICRQDNSIDLLLSAFKDPRVGCAYGRQLPRNAADPMERHARLYNYPTVSEVRDLSSREYLGIRAAFFSNSFAAYRRDALNDVGGFPKDAVVSEDLLVAARMLRRDWKVAYVADATVTHSHPLTAWQEFSRYFDIGVQHGRERWLAEEFGRTSGEGYKFVLSQIAFLRKNAPLLIPFAFMRTFSKLLGYKLGVHERHLPPEITRLISGQPNHWRTEALKDQENAQNAVTRPF